MKKIALLALLGGGAYFVYRYYGDIVQAMGITDTSDDEGDGGGMGSVFTGVSDLVASLGSGILGGDMGINSNMSISLMGLQFIKDWEAFKKMPYYATAAEKARGILTVGYGHTYKDNDLVQVEKYANGITEAEATKLLLKHIADNENNVRRNVKVKLSQNQFDALVSKVYNTGSIGATILKHLNNGDYAAAGNSFMAWVYQDGKVIAGLYNRRAAEVQMWFNNVYKR